MKKLLFIGTGGTIASELSENALGPSLTADRLLSHVPQVADFAKVEAVQPFALDSTDMTPAHWLRIARIITESYENYDGFVVAHGTDTLAYTAAALSYLIQNSKKPVILTGAQRPIGFESTDSKQNLLDSFRCAAAGLPGVLVVFGGQVILGARARKIRTKSFDAFASPNYPCPAKVEDGRLTVYFRPTLGRTRFFDTLDTSVGLLKLTPGMDAGLLHDMISRYHALVIEGFGVGGLPDADGAFRREVSAACRAGKPVVLTTQVQSEGTDLSVYRVGSDLRALGVWEAYDMTPEACFTKLMWLLPQSRNFTRRQKLFYTPVFHDLLPAVSKI